MKYGRIAAMFILPIVAILFAWKKGGTIGKVVAALGLFVIADFLRTLPEGNGQTAFTKAVVKLFR